MNWISYKDRVMNHRIEYFLEAHIAMGRREKIGLFHEKHLDLIDKAPGSKHNHQAWEGGYRDHITQCLNLASKLYYLLSSSFGTINPDFFPPFQFESAVVVLYFHDIEKIFKYEQTAIIDKEIYYKKTLLNIYNIEFTDPELNALKYIHGEGEDYSEDKRVMNPLAGFCHAVDVISARVLHNKK